MQGIARRSASITLMAIMVAGGMTIAFPGATPDAMAEPRRLANLGVSTTMFGGPMVVEIVVQDPNIDDTGIQQGAPDVTFDGKDLVMIQGDDGYWYAYVARDQVVGGIETFYRDEVGRSHRLGTGLDYGTRCEPDERDAIIPGTEFAAKNVYVANYTCGSESGQTTDVSLNVMNVVRSAKTPSTPGGVGSDPGDNIGNNGMSSLAYWPFIQTFDDISDDSQLKVIYNKGGSPQEITIRYESDMDDFASLVLDRENYPHNTFVHMTLNEALFNVDPTDEDLWSWLASVGADPTGQARAGLYYYMFDSDRELALTGPSRADDTDIIEGEQSGVEVYGDLFTLMDFGTSGPLIYTTSQFGNGDGQVRAVNPTPRDEHINRADRNPLGLPQTGNGMRLIFSEAPFLTIEETGPNTGVFTNTDGNNRSDLITGDPDSIGRDVPFTFTYADTAQNWFVGYHTGSVSMDEASVGSDWSSGERMTISVTDQDHNRNSLVQERLVIGADNPDLFRVLAGPDPSLVAGFPMIFPGAGGGGTTAAATPITPDGKTTYNENAIDLDSVGGGRHGLSTAVDNGVPISAADTLVAGLAPDRALYAQFDLREIGGPDTKFQILDQDNTAYTDPIPADGRIVRMDTMATGAAADFTGDIKIQVRDTVNNPAGRITIQMVLYLYDISDTIYQAEGRLDPLTTGGLGATLEETGLNTGIFDGTIEYTMLNQLNTEFGGAPNTETAATSTGILTDEIRLVVNGDYLDEDGIRIDYEDTDKQGQETVASAQVDAPTHSGSVSLDQDSYKQADTVSITLEDTDLNLDPQLRDVYTAITDLTDNNRDTISRAGQFYATSADQGLLLEATFDDERWISCGTAATAPKGFGTLISSIRETAPTSGVFVADFQIPDEYCSPLVEDNMDGNPVIIGASVAKTTLGKDFEVSYYDYFDSAGERNEVGDVAGITSFTGSISLDRSVYPVPFDNGNRDGASNAVFRFHETLKASDSSDEPRYVPNGAAATGATAERDDVNGDVVIHVQINDKDLDTSGSGTDRIEDASTVLKVEISRDGNSVPPASATDTVLATKEIVETSPTSGIFEIDLGIAWNDGPWQGCPRGDDAFPSEDDTATATVDERRCLLQGDIITVTYTDASD
ncbi:MAG: hypothetical protein MPJ06_09320, partial [Nitrosopumilus sp.]|nr:hypothetical protein [Nitrosopumilus sp.]